MKRNLLVYVVILLLLFASVSSAASAWPIGEYPIPAEAMAVDVSNPDHVIGTGTPESCTAEAFIAAVAKGGKIVFNGGTKPFTITLDRPAKVFNNQNPDVVIDGGGIVTLSGGGKTRILYMNTADPKQVWTTPHAQNQDHPRLVVQNITFADGNSINETEYDGGGAIWARGGRFKVVNCRFVRNRCAGTGPDVGGGAIRVFDQYEDLPVYVVNSTFGGKAGDGNIGANGGALSSIGVSWTIINSEFTYNKAIGNGGNPKKSGTPGGGSGGAIYNDGNEMTLTILGSRIENNQVNAYGAGIFFVTNNHTGDIRIESSAIRNNIGGSWYPVYPGISMHSDTKIQASQSIIKETDSEIVSPATASVFVDGRMIAFEAYNVSGNNYFKLRDLATVLSGTVKQFDVGWLASSKTITLTSNKPYTPVGGEMISTIQTGAHAYQLASPTIELDGAAIQLKAYLINGNNYFKLRDLADAIDVGVIWNEQQKRVEVDTRTGYTP